jgi:hypothetical protein
MLQPVMAVMARLVQATIVEVGRVPTLPPKELYSRKELYSGIKISDKEGK